MSYIVYTHINKINGKQYIGITCKTLRDRSKKGEGYKGCEKFYKAIKKYGWNNFKHKILFRNLTKEEAELKEVELIKEYDTQKNGYNIANGGSVNAMNEEIKEKISKGHYNNNNRKVVVYLPMGIIKTFKNINEAAERMKVDRNIIKGWCDGSIPTHTIQCYYEDDIDKHFEKLQHIKTPKGI